MKPQAGPWRGLPPTKVLLSDTGGGTSQLRVPEARPVLRDAWTLTEATGKPRAQPVPFCPRSALRGVVPGANRNDAILEPLLQV